MEFCLKMFALCQTHHERGELELLKKLGVGQSGMPFTLTAPELQMNRSINPRVNVGGRAAPGGRLEARG
jgi:hypothetical protein